MKNPSKVLSAILAGSLAMGALGASVGSVMADSNRYHGQQITNQEIRGVTDTVVTMVDGSTYKLPYGFDASTLVPGDRVAIVWTQDLADGPRTASNIFVN